MRATSLFAFCLVMRAKQAVQVNAFLYLVFPKVSAFSFGISCFIYLPFRQDCLWPEKQTCSFFLLLFSWLERGWAVVSYYLFNSPFSQNWHEVRLQHLMALASAPTGAKVRSHCSVSQSQVPDFFPSVQNSHPPPLPPSFCSCIVLSRNPWPMFLHYPFSPPQFASLCLSAGTLMQ